MHWITALVTFCLCIGNAALHVTSQSLKLGLASKCRDEDFASKPLRVLHRNAALSNKHRNQLECATKPWRNFHRNATLRILNRHHFEFDSKPMRNLHDILSGFGFDAISFMQEEAVKIKNLPVSLALRAAQ